MLKYIRMVFYFMILISENDCQNLSIVTEIPQKNFKVTYI